MVACCTNPSKEAYAAAPTLLPSDVQLERDPLATLAVSAAPLVLEGRYRLLLRALWQLRHSRRTRWGVAVVSIAVMVVLALLAIRHFATTSWPLSHGRPGLLVTAGLLLLVAQALKAVGWGQLFTSRERPSPLALLGRQRRRGADRRRLARPLRRCDADRGRAPLPGLSCRLAGDRPFACHARSGRQRCAGAARRRGRRLPGEPGSLRVPRSRSLPPPGSRPRP